MDSNSYVIVVGETTGTSYQDALNCAKDAQPYHFECKGWQPDSDEEKGGYPRFGG